MFTQQLILPESLQHLLDQKNLPEHTLFFDIETTGLDYRRSHLYLIGLIQRQHGTWKLFQYFAEKPAQEEELLHSFSLHCSSQTFLVHFNGDTFDIPYLRNKYQFYGIQQPWPLEKGLDLYKKIHPFQKLLGLSHCRQRDCEELCRYFREDPFSGGELIHTYRDFLQTAKPDLYQILLRHNQEDLYGMIRILPLLALEKLRQGQGQLHSLSLPSPENPSLSLSLKLPDFLPFSLVLTHDQVKGSFQGTEGILQVPLYQGILKHFYSNYKDYYYLPLEDTAIHKSVGAYVDSHYRRQAKASNCYQKKEGLFLPQFSDFHTPAFRQEYGNTLSYFDYLPQDWEEGSSLPAAYARHLLQFLWKA